ncbi:MAG: glutamine cyclotransferase [Edaphobacter sp.]|nr:glutamine cyclotransferase [Edaphobacter sp.]
MSEIAARFPHRTIDPLPGSQACCSNDKYWLHGYAARQRKAEIEVAQRNDIEGTYTADMQECVPKLIRLVIAVTLMMAPIIGGAAAPVYGYKVVAVYPHSTTSYTEGFFYLNGLFYEGTGLKGHSQVLVYEPKTGTVKQSVDIPAQFFGEGIVDWGPNLYEWTWQTNVGFVRDRATLKVLRQFTYSGEGWGMTRTDREFITSDGSSTLVFRDPVSFKETRRIVVKDAGTEIKQLNELEFVKGEIYANVWHSNRIARISPKDGHILGWIDLTGMLSPMFTLDSEAVLNGIAYDAQNDRLFVTGKQWPSIFEVKLIPKKLSRHY